MDEIINYLKHHQIIAIGLEYSDIIVDDSIDFVRNINKMNYYISEILWWERIEIASSNNSIGHGGPVDPRNNKFYFSETDLVITFDFTVDDNTIISYLKSVWAKYSTYCLFPSFTIKSFPT